MKETTLCTFDVRLFREAQRDTDHCLVAATVGRDCQQIKDCSLSEGKINLTTAK
jgi:hypothetical protein